MNARWIWTDSTWTRGRDGRPRIVLFGRNYDDKTKTITAYADNFEPYFYCPSDTPTGVRGYPIWNTVSEGLYTDALGRQVRKVITKLPSDVPKIRDSYDFTCEADILFDKRFLVDTGISYAFSIDGADKIVPCQVEGAKLPRIAYFDIEVKGNGTDVPNADKAEWPIVSIQVMDSYSKNITIFTNGLPQVASDQVVCANERELLRRWAAFINKLDPDVLCAWYGNYFDIPYIINRCAVLGVEIRELTRNNTVPFVSKNGFNSYHIKITGRQCFDLLDAFKKYYAPKGGLPSYGLKDVVRNKEVVGKGAFSYEDQGDQIVALFEQERWGEFLEYCRNDVRALAVIDEGIGLIEFYEYLRMIAGVKLEETLMNSRVIESIIMRAGIKPMPTKSYNQPPAQSFEGALVMNPPVGIHENVGVVDLAALYPNIIVGFDISPDVDHIIPKTIRQIMEERDKLRAIRMSGKADEVTKNKETVLKYLANSFYGVIGWPKFRLYNIEQASFITKTGRELNEYLQGCAKENGYEPIYGDTDSIFIRGVQSVGDGRAFETTCNNLLREWSKRRGSTVAFTLKFEKFYRRLMFKIKTSGEVAKKRYAGHLVWTEDDGDVSKLSTTGLETKRSDQAKITKDILTDFLERILIHDDVDGALNDVRDIVQKVNDKKASIHDVSIPKGNKDPDANNPWARGVKNTKEVLGVNIPDGVKPRLIYCRGSVKELCITDDMKEADVLAKCEVDWRKCGVKAVEMKMRTFVESIGYDWERVVEGQQGMEQWM